MVGVCCIVCGWGVQRGGIRCLCAGGVAVCAAFFRGVFGACVCLPLCGVSAALCIVLPVLAWCTAAPGRGVQILRELPENPSHHAPFTHGKFLNPIFVHSGFMKMKNQIFFTQR